MSNLRIVRTKIREDFTATQYLQKKMYGFWIDIDEEEVPNHVGISLGCYGDTGNWLSKWAGAYPELF